ncbi:DinB family protein [Streptomyces sp. NBC_01795]|uniref:DinB family protein n=1 Tax=Streptomyces sp. NBC_01795 TaxID=2975943 RepID=UPI002DD819C4|nr:DinB family protein [Streptomyces sp. NBC_01795]WSA97509.1 DinB family protein [Streptomyces sp. NBC_01795]
MMGMTADEGHEGQRATASRDIPGGTGTERELLERWLDFHRTTLEAKCEGLDDDGLRRASAPPSELTLLGLVRHLTDVERYWFRRVFDEEDAEPLYFTAEAPDDDFVVGEGDTGPGTLAVWRQEVARARKSAGDRSLEELGTRPGRGTVTSLRWIYLHMIEEYARHNGHADLLRERIDGATGV